MTPTEYAWAMTIATFLGTVLVSILVFCVIGAILRRAKSGSHRFVDRRSSKRVTVSLPVFVYGHQANTEPFFEDVTTVQVSTHGGLLRLAASVRVGQELLLTRSGTQELHQLCRVARLGASKGRRTDVAVQFPRPAPEFWLSGGTRKARSQESERITAERVHHR